MNKPKIAILTIYPFDRGGQLTSLKVVYDFCQQYFDPTVFFLGFDRSISANLKSFRFRSTIRRGEKLGMKYVEIGSRWAFWPPRLYVNTLTIWRKLFKNYQYFFVSAGTPFTAHPLVLIKKKFVMYIPSTYEEDSERRIKQLYGIRYVIEQMAFRCINKIENEVLEKANFIFPFSTYTRNRFEKILGKRRDNMEVCGHPIEISPQYDHYKNRANILLAVGRFDDDRKNLPMLMHVFKKIFKNFPQYSLYITGFRPSTSKLVAWQKYPFFKNIIFTGKITDKELKLFYQRSKVLLITSYQEGFGIVGLEALSCGTPVVATDCGGTREFIEDGKNGFLVPIDNVAQMVKRTTEILCNQTLARDLGLYGRNFVKRNFSEEHIWSIFRRGLCCVYPELKEYVEVVNESFSSRSCLSNSPQ